MFAQLKGITVVATGDITHPEWFREISEKLEPAETGLYRLKKNIEKNCNEQVPPTCHSPVRFVLNSEISSIYKKKGKIPEKSQPGFFSEHGSCGIIQSINWQESEILFQTADRYWVWMPETFLKMLLETSDQAFMVPAHIWTPWFSLLGSKSGFDSLKECFEDLSGHVFAVETGLSSNPVMNWRVSFLDRR